jgi:thiamine kinase-like enzyme
MSIPATLWKILCGGSCCGCCCAHKGENSKKLFPRTQKELEKAGAPWLTKVLTDSGVLTGSIGSDQYPFPKVEKLTFEDANDGGLLGEMCKVSVEYSGTTDAPRTLMAKFRPPDTDSQITTALFDLCEHEYDFYRTIQPTMLKKGIRIPKLVYGDYHRPSGTFIMLFEFVNGTFSTIQTPTPKEKSVQVLEKLAELHNTFWGGKYDEGYEGEGSTKPVEFINVVNEGAQSLLGGVCSTKLKTFYKGLCAKTANAAPTELKAAIKEMYSKGTVQRIQDHFAANKAWFTVIHGDTRIDNWFFNEKDSDGNVVNEIGVLDWQLMARGGSALDLSWYFQTTVDAKDSNSDGLIETYYNALDRLVTIQTGNPLPSLEEFKEELALAHVYSFCKTIIGAGGLDKNDTNTVQVMNLLCKRGLESMEAHGTISAFEKFKKGALLSQQRMGTQSTAAKGGGQVTPHADAADAEA